MGEDGAITRPVLLIIFLPVREYLSCRESSRGRSVTYGYVINEEALNERLYRINGI